MAVKILFVGIGGVGGYFGGKLAHHYENNLDVQVNFLVRGNHLKQIEKNGLLVNHLNERFVAFPNIASDNPSEIGICDYIFMCTKNYDIKSVAKAVLPCVGADSKIITLLNGVNSVEVLREIFFENEVLNGCVYILSKIKYPGVIENFGNIQKMFFGRNHVGVDDLHEIKIVLKNAGIDFTLTDSILETTWSKFVFISAVGTATSYFNIGLGEILSDAKKRIVLIGLLNEVSNVAVAKGINLKNSIVLDVVSKLEQLPSDTTSSLQRDFQNGNSTELESLTYHVIDEALKLGVDVPNYKKLFSVLKVKAIN